MAVASSDEEPWLVEPARRVGSFFLGMGVNEALAVVRGLSTSNHAEFCFDERHLFEVDMSLCIPAMGFLLCFDGLEQDLRVVIVEFQRSLNQRDSWGDEDGSHMIRGERHGDSVRVAHDKLESSQDPWPSALPPLAYCGCVFASAVKKEPCLREVCALFGPTCIGDFQVDRYVGAYLLRYPGLTFEFSLPVDWVDELSKCSEHPTEIPGLGSPTALRMWVYAGSATSYLDALSANPDEPEVVVVRPGIGVEFRSRLLRFGASLQDVFSDLGPPEQLCTKDGNDTRLHPSGTLLSRVDSPDYYCNYFNIGLDVLMDGRMHLVKMVLLHTNYPTHELFSRYNRCFFEIPIRQVATDACMQRPCRVGSGQHVCTSICGLGASSEPNADYSVTNGEAAEETEAPTCPLRSYASETRQFVANGKATLAAASTDAVRMAESLAETGSIAMSPLGDDVTFVDVADDGITKTGSVVVTQLLAEDDGANDKALHPTTACESLQTASAMDDLILMPIVATPLETACVEDTLVSNRVGGESIAGGDGSKESPASEPASAMAAGVDALGDSGQEDLPRQHTPLDSSPNDFENSYFHSDIIARDVMREPFEAAGEKGISTSTSEAHVATFAASFNQAACGDRKCVRAGLADVTLSGDVCIDVRWPWTRIREVLVSSGISVGIEKPCVVSESAHTPFGSTHFHALPGLVFEVMQNGFVASLTVCSVSSGKLPPVFELAK
eukprot:TRINITY_DN74144_c0_g1_i1.p1 TRINITY_DN74144_c0_g1~~TRINITY_DN74144_c0_g1_i1.p1  ORF type:complete len:725 (-),score=105.97 TRINITY_DN74144_c0_g1_i1:394-2568(-)